MRRMTEALACPICKAKPEIGPCEPWPKDAGPQAFYACCYRLTPYEHCVAVNGDSQRDVIERWNEEAGRAAPSQSEEEK